MNLQSSAVLLLASLVAFSSASVLVSEPVGRFPDAFRQIAQFMNKPAPGDSLLCIDINFEHCQQDFDTALGLPADITWRNGTLLSKSLTHLLEQDANEVLTLCDARAKFQQCLGAQYASCISFYNLFPQPNADIVEVYNYIVSLYRLSFICDGGFEETLSNYGCVTQAAETPAYIKCMLDFVNEVTADPSRLCRAVQNTGRCLNDVFSAACTDDPNAAGWYGCELFRFAYEPMCYDVPRCFVHHRRP